MNAFRILSILNGLPVVRIGILLFPVVPNKLCVGTLASRFSPLELLPCHQSDWFLQFRAKACIRFTPPPRRSSSAQSSGTRQTCPRRATRSWFRRRYASLRRVFEGFTFVRLSDVHLPKVLLELFLQRSPPRLFTAAAWSGLRPAPESRSRGALPHLSRSFTTQISVHTRLFLCVSAAHSSRESSISSLI